MTKPAVCHCARCEGRGFVVATSPSPEAQERARLMKLARAKAARLDDRGSARDADRWRAFADWIRHLPPSQ